MTEQVEASVPAYLHELLRPTPSGTAKLIAAWDGLTPETQILVLTAKQGQSGPAYLYEQIIEKALTSDNTYVRYLAARDANSTGGGKQEEKIRKQIENDQVALVRYACLETDRGAILDPDLRDSERFFALPHEARLAKVRSLVDSGEQIAKLISHAVKNLLADHKISELEIFEILSDYLIKPEFRDEYVNDKPGYDGFSEHMAGRDVNALWELVLEVPESISHVLIENLPESAGLSSGIPAHLLRGLSDRQLITLFQRSDIDLEDLRKQTFFQTGHEEGKENDHIKDMVRNAAVTFNFDLTDEDFARILAKPEVHRVRDLKNLAMMARDLRLCLYEAIHDLLFASKVGSLDYEYAAFAKRAFERRLEKLSGWRREKELRDLRLYRLAVQVVPWKWKKSKEDIPKTDVLTFLKDEVVEGDTWATFMAFADRWDRSLFMAKKLENSLPKIWEAGEHDDLTSEEDDDQAEREAYLIETWVREDPNGESGRCASAVQEETLQAVNTMRAGFAERVRAHNRQFLLSWIAIALLALLFLFGR